MRLARRFWIAAACTLSLLVGAASAQAQQFKLLPADTEGIVTFNLQQVLKSEVAKGNKTLIDIVKAKINEQLADKGIAKQLMKADFDLFRDLASVTVSVPGGRKPDEAFILLEGKFDVEKIEAAVAEAKEAGVKETKIANVKAFEISPQGEKTIYVGILNDKTMILCAGKADFANAVGRLNADKTNFKAQALNKLMPTVNKKQSIALVATGSVVGKLLENVPQANGDNADQVKDFLKTMDGGSVAITIQKDIDIQVALNTTNAEEAKKYAGAANLGLAFIKTEVTRKAKEDKQFTPAVDIVNSIRVSNTGSNLMIRAQISSENFGKIIENLPLPN